MDEVEGRRADNAPSAASERKRQRKKSSRSRPSSSTQPSQPHHATSATVFKSSASNATSRSLRSQRMDERSDSEAAVAQPVASSSRSPTSIEAPPPTNGAISSSASSDEDNASRSAMSATPPHKRRKKKSSTSPVQGQQQQQPGTSASTTIPHLGGARARMMAQDRERQLRRDQEEQEGSTQESSLAPAASTSRAAMDELEKSLVDARQARADVDAELVRLRNEMRFKNEVIAAQSSALSYLHTQATCTICLELAWRPHVLSPCGHTFCARCLVDWFKRPLPDEVPAPTWMVGDELRAFEEDQTQRRKKLCPHCRTKVEGPPAEVWAVKGMVDRLHQSHMAGLMAGAEGGGENHLGATVERTAAEEAQLRGEDLLSGAELWKPIFDENGGRRRIFDETDMIWRCGHCTGEIAWGECQNCHRAYTMTDDGDEEDDPDGLLYSDGYSDEEDEGDVNDVIDSLARGYRLDNAHGGHHEDEDDEANSFIVSDADSADLGYYSDVSAPGIVVDDSDQEEHYGHAHYHHAGPPRRRHGYSDEDEDEEESEDGNDGASSSSIESGSPRHHQMAAQHNRRRHPHRLAIEDDEEEDEDEDGDEDNVSTMLDGPSSSSRGAVPHGRRRHHLEDLSDDQSESAESAIADVINHDLAVESEDEYASESEDEDEGDSSNVSRFVGHGSTSRGGGRHVSPIQQRRGNGRYLVVSDSEEEEQDDHDDGYQGGRQPHASGSRYDVAADYEDEDEGSAGEDDLEENHDYDDDDDDDDDEGY